MTTLAPSKVQEFLPTSLEKIAYKSVENIPTREPNDQFRLGYHVWLLLSEKKGTLREAIKQSNARLLISESDVYKIISEALKQSNIEIE
mgnify:CR=1 FL=1